MPKPSQMKKTGKAQYSPKVKAERAAKKLGGLSGRAAKAITHEQEIKNQFYKDIMKDL